MSSHQHIKITQLYFRFNQDSSHSARHSKIRPIMLRTVLKYPSSAIPAKTSTRFSQLEHFLVNNHSSDIPIGNEVIENQPHSLQQIQTHAYAFSNSGKLFRFTIHESVRFNNHNHCFAFKCHRSTQNSNEQVRHRKTLLMEK